MSDVIMNLLETQSTPKVSAQTLWLLMDTPVAFPVCRLPDVWATCTAILGCLVATRHSAAVGPHN